MSGKSFLSISLCVDQNQFKIDVEACFGRLSLHNWHLIRKTPPLSHRHCTSVHLLHKLYLQYSKLNLWTKRCRRISILYFYCLIIGIRKNLQVFSRSSSAETQLSSAGYQWSHADKLRQNEIFPVNLFATKWGKILMKQNCYIKISLLFKSLSHFKKRIRNT